MRSHHTQGERERGPAAPSDGGDVRLIADLLAELEPYAYDAGLTPTEFRQATIGELLAVIASHRRRQARELDAMAWMVAHLLLGTGNMPKGTRVDALMRSLLGRAPGTLPGEAPEETPALDELSPEASVAYMAAWLKRPQKSTERQRA
jgi:hypothetical protein